MKPFTVLTGAFSLFSLFVPIWADQWEACMCVNKNDVNWCATAKACGNKTQNHRGVAHDGWCEADEIWIDGPEFHKNCQSKGAYGSCCLTGSNQSKGCSYGRKRSLDEPHEQALEPASFASAKMGAAAVPRNNELARRMDKRDININCLSPYGTSFKMKIVELALTLSSHLLTFTVDRILNGDNIINLAVTFLKDSEEVGYQTIQLGDGGLKTLPVPDGANGVIFLTA